MNPSSDPSLTATYPGKYEMWGYEVMEKTVGVGNATSGRINMPVKHIGKRVRIVILDP